MMKLVVCGAMLLVVATGLPACKKSGGTAQTTDAGTATAPGGSWVGGNEPQDAPAKPVEPVPPPATDAAPVPTAEAGGVALAPAGDGGGSSTIVLGQGEGQQAEAARALLQAGIALAKTGKCREAIDQHFDKVVATFEAQYAGKQATVRCGRSSVDALGQGLQAALGGGDVVVLGPEWPDALYYKAYCLVELGDSAQAKTTLQKALGLMPGDPMYLCELGDLILHESAWQQAFDTFEQARTSAEAMARRTDARAMADAGPARRRLRARRAAEARGSRTGVSPGARARPERRAGQEGAGLHQRPARAKHAVARSARGRR
jgi:hypothetical protein